MRSEELRVSPSHKYVINHVLSKFIGDPNIDAVYLFGSCAAGVADGQSDIDMFVVTNSAVNVDTHEAFALLYGCMDDVPFDKYVTCDILTATRHEFDFDATPLIRVVKREGVELRGLL